MNTTEIKKNGEDITLVNVGKGKEKFCELWPTAKTALELLVSVVKNPIAKGSISIVIAAGDAVSGRICG